MKENKKRQPLNLPNQTDQFEDVPFVHELTNHQLKVMIKRIWVNIQELATMLDFRRKDISNVLDSILDGKTWLKSDIDDRFYYGHYKGFIIQWDSMEKTFNILDSEYNPIGASMQGISIKELKTKKRVIK